MPRTGRSSRYTARTSAISHSQNGVGFVCGLSTRKARMPRSHQCYRTPAARSKPLGLGSPSSVVDVLVALGRVLGVLQRAVGAPVEPFGMLGEPRVVGRALDREVERDLDPCFPAAATMASKSPSQPSSGFNAAWPPSAPPIAQGCPDRALRAACLVATLAVRPPDGCTGGRYDDVEAQRRELRQHRGDAAEAAPRAREHSYQAPKRARSFDVDRGNGELLAASCAAVRAPARGAPFVDVTVAEHRPRTLPAEIGLTGGDLAVVLVEPARIGIDPCLDAELPAAERIRANVPAQRSLPIGASGASRQLRVPAGR